MADITDFTKQTGDFLKAEQVGKGVKAKILSEAQVVYNEKYDTNRLHMEVEVDKKKYTFDCSKTNARAIGEVLGNVTEKWVGHEIELETYRTKTSEGKMTDAINVKSVL